MHKTVYFLKDHLGSVRATVDQTGAVVGYDDYDPWGYILEGRTQPTEWSATQAVAENKFTGKERDEEFSLNWDYFGARYYDAEIGRWMVVDPLAAEHSEESPFVYTGGNPINRIDPNGMDWFRNQNTGEVEWFETSAEGFSDLERNSWMNAGTAAAYFNGSQLTAVQQTGNIFDGFTFNKVQVEAVSGRPTQSGEFDYSVERQTLIDVGPLPEGVYYMNTSAIQYWRDLGIVDKIAALLGLGTWPGGTMAWGESRVWLQPSSIRIVDPRTGKDVVRGGFSIHGGITPGSAGCIDCFSNAPQFFKFIERLQPLNMPVIVKYNNR